MEKERWIEEETGVEIAAVDVSTAFLNADLSTEDQDREAFAPGRRRS